jgi:hypothetical protein
MSVAYEEVTEVVRAIAPQVRASMTPDEVREAADEGWNVYLALDLDNPDVLFALSNRAIMAGATDFDTFTLGYAHGLTHARSQYNSGDYLKGYEAGRAALLTASTPSAAD